MEFECFLPSGRQLQEGEEVLLSLRELSPGRYRYRGRHVRAVVSRSPEALAHWDRLWVRSVVGIRQPQPWGIRILEDLGDSLPGRPYEDLFEVMNRLQRTERRSA